MPAAALSPALYRFAAVAAILWLLGLVLGNDLLSLWPAEAQLLDGPLLRYPLPALLVDFLSITFDGDVFGVRLLGVICLVLSLLALFHWGTRLFGKRTTLLALLVSISLFLPNIVAKSFHPQVVLLPFQVVFGLATLHYLKTGKSHWWVWGSLVGGALCTPLSMLVYAPALHLLLRYRHPDGGALRRLRLVPVAALLFLITKIVLAAFLLPPGSFGSLLFPPDPLRWATLHVLSLLPWLGFALAGLWHLLRRWRSPDELAHILGAWLLAAIAGGGLVIQLVLAVLIARQVADMARAYYPYRPLVIFGGVVQLVGFFFLATYAMMTGFQELGGTGFRVGMALGLVYWIPGVFGLVGLWSKGPGLLVGGRVLSGILVLLFGWLLLYPLVAKSLDLPPPPRIERTH